MDPWKLTAEDWAAAGGTTCPKCGIETVYLRPQDNLCLTCSKQADEKEDRDLKRKAKILKHVFEHNARVDKMRRGRR